MTAWKDPLTGFIYQSNGLWTVECLRHLAGLAAERLRYGDTECARRGSSASERVFRLANILAQFWSFDYYQLLFPLRFSLTIDSKSSDSGFPLYWEDPFSEIQNGCLIDLDTLLSSCDNPKGSFRRTALESDKLPPLLPLILGQGLDAHSDLLAERLLLASFVASVGIRCDGMSSNEFKPVSLKNEDVSAARMGVLASPFLASEVIESEGAQHVVALLKGIPFAYSTAMAMAGRDHFAAPVPQPLETLIPVLRRWLSGSRTMELPPAMEALEVRFVVAAPQRIQRYIFESPGLWEIRGASSLLDATIEKVEVMVAEEDGHEAIVRSAASTIEFITISPGPYSEHESTWDEAIKRKFYENAGDVWVAVGQNAAPLKTLLGNWKAVSGVAWRELQTDRNRAEVPAGIVLPFEKRCDSCKFRAASFLDERLREAGRPAWVCSTCAQKIAHGKDARGKAQEILSELGDEYRQLLEGEGVTQLAPSVGDLVAQNAKHKLTGVVFGDGDNFGGIGQNLRTLPSAVHWSRRIDEVTRASAAVAMTISIADDLSRGVEYNYLPFEVITLGGDDMSFVAAGTIALGFIQCIMDLIDSEFAVAPIDQVGEEGGLEPVTFSFGMVACDSRAPIRVVTDWAESNAMKHAKLHGRNGEQARSASRVSFIVADSVDNLPSDWDELESSLTRTVGHGLTVKSVMMPLDSDQLQFMLCMAAALRPFQGTVEGLAAAFNCSPPHAANLHYLYQRGRAKGTDRSKVFELVESRHSDDYEGWEVLFPGRIFPWDAQDSGEEYEPFTELLQLMKVMNVQKGGGDV